VQSILALCQSLLDYTENETIGGELGIRMELSIGIHTTAAQVSECVCVHMCV